MVLFLLFSAPLIYYLVNSGFSRKIIKKRVIIMPFIIGMILSIPYYLFYWLFLDSFFNNWTGSVLYFYSFINKEGSASLYISIILLIYFLFYAVDRKGSRLREITAYISGFIFTLGIYDTLLFRSGYGVLELFITPVDRLSLVFLLSLTLKEAIKRGNWQQYLWIGVLVLIPFILNFIPLGAYLNKPVLSLITAVLIFLISSFLYIKESREG